MEEMWIARDKNGTLYFHGISKPKKDTGEGMWISDNYNPYSINQDLFPEVQWSDEEPKGIKLSIKDNMEKSKIKSALSFLGRIALFVFILWCTVLGILHVIQWIIWQTFLN